MTTQINSQKIEDNFRTFSDKYQGLFNDLNKGLTSMGNLYNDYLAQLQGLISALEAEDFATASKLFAESNLPELTEQDFSDNLKLSSDIDSLKARLTHLGF